MNRYAAWGLSAALATGTVASAGDKPATFADVPPRPPIIYGPPDPAVVVEALKAEQDAYLRRLDVCLKLREIAAARNDEQLARQADTLDKQAFALYRQRVARLGVKAPQTTATERLHQELDGTANSLRVAPPEPAHAPATETRPFREVTHD